MEEENPSEFLNSVKSFNKYDLRLQQITLWLSEKQDNLNLKKIRSRCISLADQLESQIKEESNSKDFHWCSDSIISCYYQAAFCSERLDDYRSATREYTKIRNISKIVQNAGPCDTSYLNHEIEADSCARITRQIAALNKVTKNYSFLRRWFVARKKGIAY